MTKSARNKTLILTEDETQTYFERCVSSAYIAKTGDVSDKTVCGDAFAILRDFRRGGKKFDLVILDPPAFCKTADEVKDAYRGYKEINIQGMKLVKSGGFLITCSCSHYMTSTLFERMLTEAAKESGRTVRSVEVKTQAPDHPSLVCADETHYLKFYVLHVI